MAHGAFAVPISDPKADKSDPHPKPQRTKPHDQRRCRRGALIETHHCQKPQQAPFRNPQSSRDHGQCPKDKRKGSHKNAGNQRQGDPQSFADEKERQPLNRPGKHPNRHGKQEGLPFEKQIAVLIKLSIAGRIFWRHSAGNHQYAIGQRRRLDDPYPDHAARKQTAKTPSMGIRQRPDSCQYHHADPVRQPFNDHKGIVELTGTWQLSLMNKISQTLLSSRVIVIANPLKISVHFLCRNHTDNFEIITPFDITDQIMREAISKGEESAEIKTDKNVFNAWMSE